MHPPGRRPPGHPRRRRLTHAPLACSSPSCSPPPLPAAAHARVIVVTTGTPEVALVDVATSQVVAAARRGPADARGRGRARRGDRVGRAPGTHVVALDPNLRTIGTRTDLGADVLALGASPRGGRVYALHADRLTHSATGARCRASGPSPCAGRRAARSPSRATGRSRRVPLARSRVAIVDLGAGRLLRRIRVRRAAGRGVRPRRAAVGLRRRPPVPGPARHAQEGGRQVAEARPRGRRRDRRVARRLAAARRRRRQRAARGAGRRRRPARARPAHRPRPGRAGVVARRHPRLRRRRGDRRAVGRLAAARDAAGLDRPGRPAGRRAASSCSRAWPPCRARRATTASSARGCATASRATPATTCSTPAARTTSSPATRATTR